MTKLSVIARVTAAGGTFSSRARAAACSCPVEVTVVEVREEEKEEEEEQMEQRQQQQQQQQVAIGSFQQAQLGSGGGVALRETAPNPIEAAADDPNVHLVLEWAAAAVNVDFNPPMRRSGVAAGSHVVRLRARNPCDGGSATRIALRVLPPKPVAPNGVTAQGNPNPSLDDASASDATDDDDDATDDDDDAVDDDDDGEEGGFGLSG